MLWLVLFFYNLHLIVLKNSLNLISFSNNRYRVFKSGRSETQPKTSTWRELNKMKYSSGTM